MLTMAGMLAIVAVLAACNDSSRLETRGEAASAVPDRLTGNITLDGSSTVLPVSGAIAQAFESDHPSVKVNVHESGTGGGFRKFCAGEIDIAGASRPINAAELAQCEKTGVELIELPFAFDSLAIVTNPANTFANCLSLGELRRIWDPASEGKVTKWRQVRMAFPDRPLALFGPGTESGTFDYFTLAIVGAQQEPPRLHLERRRHGARGRRRQESVRTRLLRLRLLCREQRQAQAGRRGRRQGMRHAQL